MKTIKFRFGWGNGNDGSSKKAAINAGLRSFGLTRDELDQLWRDGGWLICRSDQFGEFLIHREAENGQNQFAVLDAKFHHDTRKIVDVTGYEAV